VDIGERVVGSVLGLALGDALGAPFEFQRAHRIPQPLPILTLPWIGLPPGSTTDDTAMARNLVRSLVARGGFDPEDLLRRHLEWFASEPPDVGSLTRRVLRRAASGVPAERAAREVWEERGPEVSAGNGSVMYCAPLGLAYARRPDFLPDLAPRLSALTHADERCATACLAVTAAVAAVVRGTGREEATRAALREVLPGEGGEELEFLVEAAGSARPVDGPDQGFCLFTAAVGLQALARGGGFEGEVSRVVGLGGDTDTNAAVAGALVGAAVGAGGIPSSWRERLVDADAIEAEAAGLIPLAQTGP
jgi:ADP-ribosyl-[dinitrogen reductase] hydrolase